MLRGLLLTIILCRPHYEEKAQLITKVDTKYN